MTKNQEAVNWKFKIGDKVRVVKYGHLMWSNYSKPEWQDMSPELVGAEGVVCKLSDSGYESYAVDGVPGKYAWYSPEQLELVK